MAVYNVSVSTIVTRSDGRQFWQDEMRWFGVDAEVRDWLAGSCKTALFKLIGEAEVASGPSYTLAYRTVVLQGEQVVSDTTLVEFQKMSYATVVAFQQFALDELREMQKLMIAKHNKPGEPVRRRNKAKALLAVIFQAIYNGIRA